MSFIVWPFVFANQRQLKSSRFPGETACTSFRFQFEQSPCHGRESWRMGASRFCSADDVWGRSSIFFTKRVGQRFDTFALRIRQVWHTAEGLFQLRHADGFCLLADIGNDRKHLQGLQIIVKLRKLLFQDALYMRDFVHAASDESSS